MTTLSHHELCFGCGQANLFGLQLELERDGDGVAGRCFLKQDHQGPPGFAHGGVVTAALDEAMALLVAGALTQRMEVDFLAPVPVGGFLEVEARVERRDDGRTWARASGRVDGEQVAVGRAVFAHVTDRRTIG